ncbi:MAG: glutamate racemase [Cyclobacterium sp.]|uniref:glutamate racemase n=1 Tax=unclassified Cyclobacterium TaxID=2615055 RepID=UPI0013D75F35|nr:glutamate racemase [Cyclobacterium sp. SYSU L10401]
MGIKAQAPIGIFDSGIGGLTVAKEVKKLLPDEQIIYFGDTAHLPYGDKSTAAIQAYSVKIADVLIKENCKLILIACNSASAAAFELVKAYVASKAHVFNVIDPVVHYLREVHPGQQVGLIGTKQTVSSGVYLQKINDLGEGIVLKSLATPLLAPMIEEGFHKENISNDIIASYLSQPVLRDIQALVLACTHYPLIKTQIQAFYKNKIDLIDASETVAGSVASFLGYHQLLAKKVSGREDQFLVSDYTVSFEETTKLFFGKQIKLQKYPLWE